jgi:hypothetical protein
MLFSSTTIRLVAFCALVASVGTLSGCLISSRSRETQSGTFVSETTFNQIQPGVTTKQWVLGTLGEPSLKTPLENGEELWKWSYCKTRESSGSLLFVFGGSSTSSTMGAAYVQFKDGVVSKSWRAN